MTVVNTVADTLPNQSLVAGLKTRYWVIFTRAHTLFLYSTKPLHTIKSRKKYYLLKKIIIKEKEIMTTSKMQKNEKITSEGEENMTDLSNTFKPNDVNKKEIDDTGNETCKHCRGTGVNPKYEKVNKIINAILDYTYRKKRTFYSPTKSDVPFCIYCLGEGTIHRNQNNNKKDKKEILSEYAIAI